MEVEELKTIVEKGFRDLAERMQAGFADVDSRFAGVDARMQAGFADVDSRMQVGFADVDSRMQAGFADVDSRMQAGFADVDSRMTEGFAKLDDRIHQTQMLVERLEGNIRQIGEGVEMHHAEFRRHVTDTDQRFEEIHSVIRHFGDKRRKRTTGRARPSR